MLSKNAPPFFQLISDQSNELPATMNTEFDFSFLEEGFSARDTVEQKINESSTTVRIH